MSARVEVAVFLQVRLGSTRLPRKALLPLGDSTVVEQTMRALKGVRCDLHVMLTDQASADQLRACAERHGYALFVGSPDDVLDRFVAAARQYGVRTVVRATGDNPLVSAEVAEHTIAERRAADADYCALFGTPLGTGVEVVQAAALERAWYDAATLYEREHVTPYIYGNPTRFLLHRPAAPQRWRAPGISATVDTAEQYRDMQRLYAALYHGKPIGIESLVEHAKGALDADA